MIIIYMNDYIHIYSNCCLNSCCLLWYQSSPLFLPLEILTLTRLHSKQQGVIVYFYVKLRLFSIALSGNSTSSKLIRIHRGNIWPRLVFQLGHFCALLNYLINAKKKKSTISIVKSLIITNVCLQHEIEYQISFIFLM